MKNSPKIIGLAQALGIIAYVSAFAFVARFAVKLLQRYEGPDSVVPIVVFLSAFVTSALICACITFAYPTFMVFDGMKRKAVFAVLWTALWLGVLSGLLVSGLALL